MIRDNGINYMESLSSIELNNIFNNKYRGNTPLVLYANGGSWDKLSMRERYNYIHNNYDILANGGTLDDIKRRFAEDENIVVPADENIFSSGGSIHIKPENRGKFTALKKRTGHSASWFKAHGTPAQRKMATFALNARKWKHGDGGRLFGEGGNEDDQPLFVESPVEAEYPKNGGSPDMTWHKWWLYNRADKIGRNIKDTESHPIWAFQELTGINFPGFEAIGKERIPKLLDNASKYTEYIGGWKEIPDEIWKSWRGSFPRQLSMSDEDFDALSRVGNVTGSTDNYMKYVYYPNPTEGTVPHERAHILWARPMERKIDDYNFRKRVKKGVDNDYYYDGAREIYARLMAFRNRYNLNPKHKVTKEDLEVLRNLENSEESGSRSYLFDRYNDDFLLYLFNEVANNGSLQDFREQFANQAAFGGPIVKAANKHLYGGESENTQQMDIANSYPMSLEEYIAQRIQDTRDSAANVMRTRGMPRVFYSNKKGNQRASEINAEIAQAQQQLTEVQSKLQGASGLSKQILEANIEALEGNIYNMSQEMYKAAAYGEGYIPVGSTCLYTLTDSYGKDRAVPGTQSFMANVRGTDVPLYQAKGFRRLSVDEQLEPSDPIIFFKNGTPHHAEMSEGYSEKRQPKGNKKPVRTTYSNGQYTSEAMRVNKDYNWFDPDVDAAFRFVGNAADSARWTKEYNELMQNGPIVEKALGGRLFDEGGETEEEYYPIWLDGITVKPLGNRPTARDDWNWANWREKQNEREQQAAESVRRGIDRNGTPITAGIYGLMAAPFAVEGLGSSTVANGVRTGLQAMNTAFTPSTWLNPVTGTKLLSPTVGTIADAGVQGAFAYEGLNGLWNQGNQGTLLSDPASTFVYGLESLPFIAAGTRGVIGTGRTFSNTVGSLKDGIEKRAIETVMRTTTAPNPTFAMKRNLEKLWQNDKQRLWDIGKYILTGKKTGPKGRYNSFVAREYLDYPRTHTPAYNTGFFTSSPVLEKDDVIDAILYGKTVDPEWGLIKADVGKNFGLHTQHIAETYPGKARNIQVYELDSPNYVDESKLKDIAPRAYGAEEDATLFRTTRYPETEYDAAGHMERLGVMDNGVFMKPSLVIKPEDIYAFNSKRYKSRWLDEDLAYRKLPSWKRKALNYMLNRVEKHVTPIVVKGPWIKRSPYAKDIDKHPDLKVFYDRYNSLGGPLIEYANGGHLFNKGGHKFSNTPVGRAMQRQYDLEHGIAMQKVIPETEVMPNPYYMDENGYGNIFAIPYDKRPSVLNQEGELQDYKVPVKLLELNWLNRTLGINNLTNTVLETIFSPANIVPSGKVTLGIEALAGMSSGKAPVEIELNLVPNMIQVGSNSPSPAYIKAEDLPMIYKMAKDPNFVKTVAQRRIEGYPIEFADLREFADDVTVGVPDDVKLYLIHNNIERNAREIEKMGGDANAYRSHMEGLLENVNIGLYTMEDYANAGHPDWGGFFDKDRNFISLNKEATGLPVNDAMAHEAEHLMTMHVPLQKHQLELLYNAYGDLNKIGTLDDVPEFMKSPDFDFDVEIPTLNADSRKQLFKGINSAPSKFPLNLQDALIDKVDEELIISAIENASGYGQLFIRYLRENNLLTPERIKAFREAMKYAGAIAPVGSAAAFYNRYLSMAPYYEAEGGPIFLIANRLFM